MPTEAPETITNWTGRRGNMPEVIVGTAIILLAWICTFVASIGVAANAFQRWGRDRGLPGILCPPGVAMTSDLFIHQLTAITVARASGSALNLPALGFAILGIALAITGWVKTHPREFPAGCCRKCGYELKDLPRCPECGTERSATTKEDGQSAGDGTTNSPAPPPDSPASSHDTTL